MKSHSGLGRGIATWVVPGRAGWLQVLFGRIAGRAADRPVLVGRVAGRAGWLPILFGHLAGWAAGRPFVVALAVLAGAAGVLAGCGVPTEREPRNVPSHAMPDAVPQTAVPTGAQPGTATEPLCFVRDGYLVRVVRRAREWPTVETQVQHMLAGPDADERRAGLTSALTGTTVVTGIRLSGGEATVELSGDPDQPGRSDEILAFGQIVCAVTARSDVTGVRFERDGQRLDVPRADGSLSQAPLSAADYADLIIP